MTARRDSIACHVVAFDRPETPHRRPNEIPSTCAELSHPEHSNWVTNNDIRGISPFSTEASCLSYMIDYNLLPKHQREAFRFDRIVIANGKNTRGVSHRP